MSQIGFQAQVSKGWQRNGVVLLWLCEISLMKTQNKKLYDRYLIIFCTFRVLTSSVQEKGTARPSFCMSSLLKVDAQLDLDRQEEDIKSVAATMYAGMFFPNKLYYDWSNSVISSWGRFSEYNRRPECQISHSFTA